MIINSLKPSREKQLKKARVFLHRKEDAIHRGLSDILDVGTDRIGTSIVNRQIDILFLPILQFWKLCVTTITSYRNI